MSFDMKYISMCSGICAPSVAWTKFGWTPVAFSEIADLPSAVLRHRYPGVPNHGDFAAFDWNVYRGKVDVLVAGTPCQAFSMAGERRSLSDDRGQLALGFINAANAIDPEFIVWENVLGTISTKDNAFGCFLAGLVGSNEPIVPEFGWKHSGMVRGPKRSACWRVLDAQYFGIAQRRRRLFVVASRNGSKHPGSILFEPKTVPWPSGEGGKTRDEDAGFGRACLESSCERLLGFFDETTITRPGYHRQLSGDGPCFTMCSQSRRPTLIFEKDGNLIVRRMDISECEIIQGFEPGYTHVPVRTDGNGNVVMSSDGPRYYAIGNSMAVPVLDWIGRGIIGGGSNVNVH
jgi:DNA (cytosine-5)-methyltransferase 1